MPIKDINVPATINTPEHNPYDLAIIPLLKESTTYLRGVSYFYSEWVELAKDGLVEFVQNNGKMKLLTSIQIDEDELIAFKTGEEAKVNAILKEELVNKLRHQTQINNNEWTLNYLSWMISENILEVRVSVHKKNDMNIYHNKVAIFSDGQDAVCLHGSLNDSKNALGNQEAINSFISWESRDNERIINHKKRFYDAWNGDVENYIVLELPEIIKIEFEKIKNSSNPFAYINNINDGEDEIRDYQNEAIECIEKAGWNGILNMATGTGKTLTSLFALDKYKKSYPEAIVCIVVPQLHLLFQWSEIIDKRYKNKKIIHCAVSKKNWGSDLFRITSQFDSKSIFVLTTYKTLIDNTFQNAFKRLSKVIYIFDECHKLGSNEIKRKLSLNSNSNKIGLSATPNRWLDSDGDEFIKSTIGRTVYNFTLKDAIEKGFLVSYNYNIHLTELSVEENYEFNRLSQEIGKYSAMKNNNTLNSKSNNNENIEQKLRKLYNDRADISKGAMNKFKNFFEVFEMNPEKKHSIVYVFDKQVHEMVDEIRSRYHLNVHGIIASTPIKERSKILKGFNEGEIDVLVAIQCLDEGVDIPSCKSVYILSSSTNPREFIQRRGRVLRLFKNKKIAEIYDFISIGSNNPMITMEEKASVIKRELPRVSEFTSLSNNSKSQIEIINYLIEIESLYLYEDQMPWEIDIIESVEEEVNE